MDARASEAAGVGDGSPTGSVHVMAGRSRADAVPGWMVPGSQLIVGLLVCAVGAAIPLVVARLVDDVAVAARSGARS